MKFIYWGKIEKDIYKQKKKKKKEQKNAHEQMINAKIILFLTCF